MTRNSIPKEVTEAAADWLDQLDGGLSQAQRAAFIAWLQHSPVHVEEFLQISVLRSELSGTLQRDPEWVAEFTESEPDSVIELPKDSLGLACDGMATNAISDDTPRRNHLVRRVSVAAVVVVMVMAGWIVQESDRADPANVITALGEQRSVLLSDGSTLTVNTDSRVAIEMTPAVRGITLVRGELFVDVAKDPVRPFRVLSGTVLLEALGTRFNVYRRRDDTVVTVVEGVVKIARLNAPRLPLRRIPKTETAAPVELHAGSHAIVAQDEAIVEPTDVNLATAWTKRRLMFENETVGAVVNEFNRYNRMSLKIEDQQLAQRRITGVFDVNDPDAFVDLLAELEPIAIRTTSDGHRILRRRTQ